jgi:hypothetical protein
VGDGVADATDVGAGRLAVGDGGGGADSGMRRRAMGRHATVSKVKRTANATTETARFLTMSFYLTRLLVGISDKVDLGFAEERSSHLAERSTPGTLPYTLPRPRPLRTSIRYRSLHREGTETHGENSLCLLCVTPLNR